MEPKVTIYTLDYCPYCTRAKSLLEQNGISYQEIKVKANDDGMRTQLEEKSGMRTFPQIFYENQLIGGFSELKKLDEEKGIKNLIK